MKKVTRTMSLPISKTAFAFLFAFFLLALGCKKSNERNALKDFHQVNLVDNNGSYGAALHNPTLRNAWGIAFSPGGIAWVNANAGHVSELFDQDGNPIRTPVNIPSPLDTIGGTPTGIVFNSTPDFLLSDGGKALFIFVGDDGVLSGWNQAAGNNALRIKNNASTAVYKGLALASSGGANFLYAADFKTGKIDVWDKYFTPVNMSFSDPNLPSGYAPFNIQLVGNWLVVLYAKVGPEGDEETGQGFGFVNIFNTDGSFVKRFASRGWLNAPWGVAQAPASFFDDNDGDNDDTKSDDNSMAKKHGHDDNQPILLVGNFGDGRINGFSLDGEFLGQLKSHGKTIVINGLWALSFPPTTSTIDQHRLYFAAGPNDEMDGLFGYLIKQ
jgi:uncharacterized protein (TIGR03118 family)